MIDLSQLANLHALEPVDLALHWAARGLPVLPTNPISKAPWVGRKWEVQATLDPARIRAWWEAKPGARVGIKTGLACGCGCLDGPDVLDFDVTPDKDGLTKPGIEQRRILVEAGILDGTKALRLSTPSGGEHWWFRGSQRHNVQNDDSVWGVDLRAHHGMVLAPGNPGYEIRSQPWDDLAEVKWTDIAACPGILQKPVAPRDAPEPPPATGPARAGMAGPPRPPAPPRASASPKHGRLVSPASSHDDTDSPLDWYCQNNDLELLIRTDGWSYCYESEGRRHYARPGKKPSLGPSGNVMVNPDGRQTLYSFSSSVDLPINRAISAAQYYAHTEHGGNTQAAARAIRTGMMPRPVPPPARPVTLPVSRESPAGTDAPRAAPGAPEGSTSTDLVLVAEVGPPPMVREFWDQRRELSDIRWLARERRVSPWATLGAVLAMVTCRVGPHVVLPPIVGGVASLNLLIGLVGPSGKGKGAAWAVAEEYLDVRGRFPMEEVGTSQGIDSCFTETSPKTGTVQFNDVAFFYVPEIDTFKAHSEMSGSALIPHLRKIWSGEALGARYAKAENRRPVRAHTYRASVVAGIQPARSGVLLADVDGGLPQRWLWLPVRDPGALRRTARLKPPAYMGSPPRLDYDVWIPAGEQRGEKNEPLPVEVKSRWEIRVCKEAAAEIIDAREENLVSEHGSLDSHSLLTRLKTAWALAFLSGGRMDVSKDDWELSSALMWVSNDTRAECQRAVEEAEQEDHARRGRGRATSDAAADIARVSLADRRVGRIQDLGLKVLGKLQEEPGKEWSPRALIKLVMDSKTARDYSTDVLAAVVAVAGVTEGPEISSGGQRIKKLSWTASDTLAGRA